MAEPDFGRLSPAVCYSPSPAPPTFTPASIWLIKEFLILNRFSVVIRIWAVSLAVCVAIVALAFQRMDVPAALYFWSVDQLASPLNVAFGSAVILTGESAVILFAVFVRLATGHISTFGRTLAIACLVSMCAYVVNDHLLKVFFGVPNPADVVHGAAHSFNFWQGSVGSSFPSGHMVLAGAFAGVFMRLYKRSIRLFSALLLVAAALLLVGDWHFLSDIVAGAFLGISAGVLAGEGWAAHSRARTGLEV